MRIIGHRGARREAPENTLAGFRHLRALGIDHVELDVRLSRDNQLVVLHDTTVNRTTNGKGAVREMTADELGALNAAANFSGWNDSTPVPLLRDVLAEWNDLESIQLEVKTTAIADLHIIATGLVQLINELDLIDVATVTSMDTQMLAIMHQKAPDVRRGYVAERFTRDPLAMCHLYQCDLLATNYHRASPQLIDAAHDQGLELSVWTVNDLNVARRLYDWGADSIITDVPTLMLEHLPQCASDT